MTFKKGDKVESLLRGDDTGQYGQVEHIDSNGNVLVKVIGRYFSYTYRPNGASIDDKDFSIRKVE
jgi:ribosomal protein L24